MLVLIGTVLAHPRRGPGYEGYGYRGYEYGGYRGYKGYRGPTYDFGIHTGGYGGAGYGK